MWRVENCLMNIKAIRKGVGECIRKKGRVKRKNIALVFSKKEVT